MFSADDLHPVPKAANNKLRRNVARGVAAAPGGTRVRRQRRIEQHTACHTHVDVKATADACGGGLGYMILFAARANLELRTAGASPVCSVVRRE